MRTPWARSSLLAIGLAFAAFPAALAGSATAPEITDAAADQSASGVPVDAAGFKGADVQAAWIDGETDTSIRIHLQAGGDVTGGNAGGQPTTYYHYLVSMKQGGKEYQATAEVHWEAVLTPGGVTSAGTVEGAQIHLTVPRSAIGDPPAGSQLTDLWVEATVTASTDTHVLVSDRAPDEGFGTPYTFKAGKQAAGARATSAAVPTSSGSPPSPPQNGTAASDAPAGTPASGNATSDHAASAAPATTQQGNATEAPALNAQASTPGPGLAAVMAGLAAAAWTNRRR